MAASVVRSQDGAAALVSSTGGPQASGRGGEERVLDCGQCHGQGAARGGQLHSYVSDLIVRLHEMLDVRILGIETDRADVD